MNGHQLDIAEKDINTGSLYICCSIFLALGLDSNDPFWSDEFAEWTSLKAWNGHIVNIDQSIDLLVDRPSSYSCPSTHSGWAFSAATSVALYFRKFGIALLVLATIISFSRIYLFVHFPTDVLLGIVIGIISSLLTKNLVEKLYSKNKII